MEHSGGAQRLRGKPRHVRCVGAVYPYNKNRERRYKGNKRKAQGHTMAIAAQLPRLCILRSAAERELQAEDSCNHAGRAAIVLPALCKHGGLAVVRGCHPIPTQWAATQAAAPRGGALNCCAYSTSLVILAGVLPASQAGRA